MRALTLQPGRAGSAALRDFPEPRRDTGSVLVSTLAVGVCGTDRDILEGGYGEAPEGEDYLVLGHEALGRVLDAPHGSGLAAGDLVAPIVRRPDPAPCINCAAGEWDMCRNAGYTELGIKQRHGFARERFRADPEFLVGLDASLERVGVLVEPASVVAKAWDHIERIGGRARWEPRRVAVTGAGPVGLLAAMMGRQRGLEVHVLDIVTEGPKPSLVEALGARYSAGGLDTVCSGADILIECTGAGQLVFDAMQCTPPGGIVCLAGLSTGERKLEADMAALNHALVLENDVVFGTVSANRRHYEAAARSLMRAERGWLEGLISRREPLERWEKALERRPEDVKTVIEIG